MCEWWLFGPVRQSGQWGHGAWVALVCGCDNQPGWKQPFTSGAVHTVYSQGRRLCFFPLHHCAFVLSTVAHHRTWLSVSWQDHLPMRVVGFGQRSVWHLALRLWKGCPKLHGCFHLRWLFRPVFLAQPAGVTGGEVRLKANSCLSDNRKVAEHSRSQEINAFWILCFRLEFNYVGETASVCLK